MNSHLSAFITALFLFVLISCGSVHSTSEDYGNLMDSPSGLTLTESEHVHGWGRTDCSSCHNLSNIHLNVSEDGYDMEAVREQVTEEGIAGCSTCHGTNGVE